MHTNEKYLANLGAYHMGIRLKIMPFGSNSAAACSSNQKLRLDARLIL
jgi:hypothetical protein